MAPDPQTFDTGLEIPQRTLLRRGVVSALAPLTKAGGGYLVAVRPIAPVVLAARDEDGVAEMLAALDGGSPIIGVALSAGVFTPSGMGGLRDHYEEIVEVLVYILSDNAAGALFRVEQSGASLADHTLDPGIEVISEHAQERLIGLQVDDASKTIHQLVPLRVEELWHDAARCVWVQRYSVLLERDLAPHKGVTQHVTLIHTEHRVIDAEISDEEPLTVDDWDGPTKLLTFTTPRPAGIVIGTNLVVKHGSGALDPGVVVGVDTDSVTVAIAFVSPPVAGELVYVTTNPLIVETTLP